MVGHKKDLEPMPEALQSSTAALKIMYKEDFDAQGALRIIREVEIMSRCQGHAGICRLDAVFETDDVVALALELCEGGELFQKLLKLRAFPESQAVPIFAQIVAAVAFLHANGVVHRDLKMENIMFSDASANAQIKLVDFGFARYASADELLYTPCGTADYVAPELAIHEGHAYQRHVDAWALGVVLFVMLCGFPPFAAKSDIELLQSISHGHFTFPTKYWSHISDEAKDLVRALLEVNPKQRLTPAAVLEHPWITRRRDAASTVQYSSAAVTATPPAEAQLRRSLLLAEHLIDVWLDPSPPFLR